MSITSNVAIIAVMEIAANMTVSLTEFITNIYAI